MSIPSDSGPFDFFVSYSRQDNKDGWITQFIEALQAEQRERTGGREFRVFFDKDEIRSLDDWRHRLYESLSASRLLVAFLSPRYFASEWCRREWRTWIDLEIAKHILSDGAASLYIVEVPWMDGKMKEQEVAAKIAELGTTLAASSASAVQEAMKLAQQIRSRRQLTKVQPFFSAGLDALRKDDLRSVLSNLARDLDERATRVVAAESSPNTIPDYNKRFCGRLDELNKLRELLDDDRAGVITSVHGLGGMGKTELAFTYAHAFASLYPGGRYLLSCATSDSLRHAALALDQVHDFRSQIPDDARLTLDSHFTAIREVLRRHVREHGRVLLVLDNVNKRDFLSPQETDHFAGFEGKLHLLATTRLGPPSGTARAGRVEWLTLDSLPEADSLELLEKHRDFADDSEHQAAQRIVRRLGGFTLAVELVAAYLEQHPDISYVAFLERLGLEDLETLEELGADTAIELRRKNDEHRLSAVLAPTLAGLTEPERCALEFASLLHPDFVVLPWLRQLVGKQYPEAIAPAKPGYPDPWQQLEHRLFSLALLSRSQDEQGDPRVVRCHRLVQDYVSKSMVNAVAYHQDVNTLIKERDEALRTSSLWRDARWELYPLTALSERWNESEHPAAAWLANQMGLCWHDLAEWSSAEPLMRRALQIDETSFGNDHPKVAIRLNNLAQLLQDTNRLTEAEPLMRRALQIDETSFGNDHPNVARNLNNLALLLKATNRLTEAEPLMRRALQIDDTSFGNDHPNVAIRLNNLALLLKATNRLTEAEPLMRRALQIDETSFGNDHPNVAIRLNNLALLLQATNRLTEAEPLIRRALQIDETSFGNDHPNVARNLNNLAQLLQDTNRLTEAEPLMRRALQIDETSFGNDHPNVARNLNNLASLLQATNRLTEAEPLIRRALQIDETSFGNDHPNVAIDLNNLALLLQATNRLTEAEPLMRRALRIDETSFGNDHPNVARNLNNLASLLQATNRLTEAEPLIRRALQIDETSFGNDHPNVAIRLNNLALLLQATNRLTEAEPLIRRALQIDETSFGNDHPNVARNLNNLAQLLQDTNRLTEAEPLMRRALRIFTASLGEHHPRTVTVRENYEHLRNEMEGE